MLSTHITLHQIQTYMKSFFQKFFKILVIILKVITALVYVAIVLIQLLDNDRVDTSSVWLIPIFLSYPLVMFLDRWSQNAAKDQRFRLRIYLSGCFMVFEMFTVALIPELINSFAYVEPKYFNPESLFGVVLLDGLLFMFYWLWWGKISRNKADQQIVKNFRNVPNSVQNRDEKVIEIVKATETLKHKFHAVDPGESYREYFPVMMTTKDGKLHFGAHYYDEHSRTSGQDKHHIHVTYRHAYWLFPVELPDLLIKKMSQFEKVVGGTALNPDQVKFLNNLNLLMERFEFRSLQVADGAALIVRRFPANLAALGERPIPVEELWEITEELHKFI